MFCKRIGALILVALLFSFLMRLDWAIIASPVWPPVDEFTTHYPEFEVLVSRDAELDAERDRLYQEINFARHLAEQLAAGQLCLHEATDRMEPILCQRPGFRTVCGGWSSVDGTRRRTARYLIQKVETLLDPSRWPDVSSRLEAEYLALR
jgi:hypothetical protein